jgi:hypothetical protein
VPAHGWRFTPGGYDGFVAASRVGVLTLHMIEAEGRSQRLERQNQELHDRVARLEKGAAGEATAAK